MCARQDAILANQHAMCPRMQWCTFTFGSHTGTELPAVRGVAHKYRPQLDMSLDCGVKPRMAYLQLQTRNRGATNLPTADQVARRKKTLLEQVLTRAPACITYIICALGPCNVRVLRHMWSCTYRPKQATLLRAWRILWSAWRPIRCPERGLSSRYASRPRRSCTTATLNFFCDAY